jgi:hypothetical protein
MRQAKRLFPELRQGASLRWFFFQFAPGGGPRDDLHTAIARRKAGLFVRLIPREAGALHWLIPEREPPYSLL